ncbi:MAG: hypothetical protein FD138_4679 [Planctomycetota bacterium]|nr:MAG: hypothetical protein FD138_4679 [Planctomycetota bacterium]
MEEILKAFSVSFLLRSIFAGVFFPISYCSGRYGLDGLESALKDSVVTTLSISLFAGVTAYGFHRSMIYPLLEWGLNSKCAEKHRSTCFSLVSNTTMEVLLSRWKRTGANANQEDENAKHFTTWADYTHLQYVSAECIAFGAIACRIVAKEKLSFSWPLTLLAVLLAVAAIVSDWRLHSVLEFVARRKAQPSN